MSADVIEGITRAVLEELVEAVVAGTDERAAIARAVEQLRATEVHGPISAGVEARIARVTGGRVHSDPAIHGGDPVIRGTRVPVSAVAAFARAGHSVDSIRAAYPHLAEADVEAALRYDSEATSAAEHAATEARVSAADVDILRRLATQHALTLEERGAATRAAHWMGARLAIPLPPVLDSERAEGEP